MDTFASYEFDLPDMFDLKTVSGRCKMREKSIVVGIF